jgi:alkylation response protein AidB-like acyl-CoA dehydrogenase
MRFELTDQQRDLMAAVRGFFADRFPLEAVRVSYDDPADDGDPSVLWKAAGEQGWLAVCIPERFDGLGLGLLDAAVLARCWGAGVVPGSILPTLLAAEAIRLAGSPEQQAAWLPQVAAGAVRLSLAAGDGAPDTPQLEVTADGGGLTGRAAFVEYAAGADRLVVAARTGADTGLWLVDPAAPGTTVTAHAALDRTTRLYTVDFAGAAAERLAGSSAATLAAVLDRAAVLAANDLAGIAREALTRTVDFVKTREQFGRPVGSFQAVKHALADLHVGTTMAEHAAWYAAHAIDESLPDARLAASVAKAKASEAARDATAAMIQYHGGIGYAWEHDAHFYFKRAKRLEYQYGDQTHHLERIARLVVDG